MIPIATFAKFPLLDPAVHGRGRLRLGRVFWVYFMDSQKINKLDPAVHGRGRLRLCCVFGWYAERKSECSVQSCAEDQNFQIVRCNLLDEPPYLDFWRVTTNRLF